MTATEQYLSDEQLLELQELSQTEIPTLAHEPDSLADELPLLDYEDSPDYSEKILFSWVAPERAWRKNTSKNYRRNLILLLLLIFLLLFFTSQFGLLVVVLALAFLAYVLINVKPPRVRHTITNYGIYTHNKFYSWLNRGKRFWYEDVYGQEQVIVETRFFPYRLVMMVGLARNKPKIEEVLKHYLILQKPQPTKTDKFIAWWQTKFPLG